ncbi:amidohydrolase [Candidatus Bathyarchaeota archaeon]|nr:amidohydrolase [Candidatus Bathyarchaeota archaeon]
MSPGYMIMLADNPSLVGRDDENSIRALLLKTIKESTLLDGVVLLAMDAVHDSEGNPLHDQKARKKTHLFTPNDCVAKIAGEIDGDDGKKKRIFFGASVHPDRREAVDELDHVADMGAALVKWIPSSQDIDPLRNRYKAFYQKLADLKMPLLCHVGAEHTVPTPQHTLPVSQNDAIYNAFNHPNRLIPALAAGVTVIAAHCATPVLPTDSDWTDDFITLMQAARNIGWKLYADVSALALGSPWRLFFLRKLVKELPRDRLLLGSDYPIPVSALLPGVGDGMDPEEWAEALLTPNPLDKNVRVIRALGFADEVLTNAEKVLRLK